MPPHPTAGHQVLEIIIGLPGTAFDEMRWCCSAQTSPGIKSVWPLIA